MFRYTTAVGVLSLGLAAGCGGAAAATHSAPTVTVTAPASAPAPVVTDPSGGTCSSLDGQGYCPGDDPTTAPATPTASGSSAAFAAWYGGGTGTGYTDFEAVGTDLTTMQNDATAGNVSQAETDGTQLATDAAAAAADPMPVDTTTYVTAMNQLTTAGNDAADGDFTDATSALQESAANMNAITAVVKGMTP
jgi:hypothetical protein